ncbi:hypothetical protein L0F81_00280 [Streptomyces tricolor]|uniref:Uncharacterized protein n=1 Tax=Streptomyces tricolor TaxID=68277 RepID=A0ABS9J844_9ACTN|nr:hypothetical protein [Streptomyces tricolor]MCG0061736.1 hypothetical protein [Streptomyces tricolor]
MPAFGLLLDDFDDGVRDPVRWSGSYGAVSEAGGRARVPVSTGFSGYASAPQYTLAGAQVACRVYPPAVGGAASEARAEVFVITAVGGTDAGFSLNAVTGELACLLRSGYYDPAPVTVVYSSTAHAWMRLREVNGSLHWDVSADAGTWTTLRTAASPAWAAGTDLAVVLAGHRDSGTNDFAEFDNFNIVRPGELRPLQRGLAGPGPNPRTASTVRGG